jgi:hypothetical protein
VNGERVSKLLREAPVPDETGAEERVWRVVRAVAARQQPTRRRGRGRLAAAAAAVALILVGAFTPPGAAVADWVHDAVTAGHQAARPALTSLPTDGRLLVVSERGVWVVQRDGSKRRLGNYDEAHWSPNGLFVVATRGRQLVALDPKGEVRWSIARSHRIHNATWSPDGYRIAYLAGGALRMTAADGTGDRLLRQRAGRAAPAWRPGSTQTLTFSDSSGRITSIAPDRNRRLWATSPGPTPDHLAWTADGRRLVALAGESLRVLGADGRLLSRFSIRSDARPSALAVHPGGNSVAVTLRDARGRSEVLSFPLHQERQGPRRLFAGQGSFTDLSWSPDGRWLLVGWREANQWLFVRSTRVKKVDAVSNIARQFEPGGSGSGAFPTIGGWCCAR